MNQFRKYIYLVFKLNVLIPLVISIIILIILVFSVELKYAVFTSTFFLLGYILICMVEKYLHKHFSSKAVFYGGFIQLLNNELIDGNFEINSFKETNYLFGNYRGYDFDIVYDSNYLHNFGGFGFRQSGGHVFIVYHQPISLRKKLQLEERYYPALVSFRPYRFLWSRNYVEMQTTLSLITPSYRKIKKRMDMLVDMLENEKMLPMKKGQKQ